MSELDDSMDEILAEVDDKLLSDPPPAKIPRLSPTPTTSAGSNSSELQNTGGRPAKVDSAGGAAQGGAIRKVTKQNCILVCKKQRGNPVLKFITNVPWEWDDIVPDYIVGATTCILYLSLKYHNLNPDYIHQRLKTLGKMFELRILLVQVDIKDPHNALKTLTRICLLANLTLILAWSIEEAGKIIETYKMYEKKPAEALMERADSDTNQRLVTALTNIKPINKTDAMNLLKSYGTLENLINTSESKLASCVGLGPRKADKLFSLFSEPFMIEK